MKKLLTLIFASQILASLMLPVMAREIPVITLSESKINCLKLGARVVRHKGELICIVRSKRSCNRIGGKISNISSGSYTTSCLVSSYLYAPEPGIEGSDIGSGG